MDVAMLKMDRHEARRAMRQYQTMMKSERTPEDQKILTAYRRIARGEQLMQLTPTLQKAGLDHEGNPQLAIVRADQKTCWADMWRNGDVRYRWTNEWNKTSYKKYSMKFDNLFQGHAALRQEHRTLTAIVPSIPPEHRPPKDKLHLYHILWDADWKEVPVDPFLLKHIRGDLYAVVAQWDLTPVERAVLAGM
jgi:hypothetical protein